MNTRTAVVLLNLGGPDSLDAIEPFLFNLFSDPAIFRIPFGSILQAPLARLIARKRAGARQTDYEAIGGRSPILDNTRRQADALARALADDGHYDVHVCMRYWHPMSAEVVAQLKSAGYRRIVLLPLYPQYSITTTGSSFDDFDQACKQQSWAPRITRVQHRHTTTRCTWTPWPRASSASAGTSPGRTRNQSSCCSPLTACRRTRQRGRPLRAPHRGNRRGRA